MRDYLMFSFMVFLLSFAFVQDSSAEWKFGIALGTTDIDYDLTDTVAGSAADISADGGADSADDASTYVYDTGYTATELTFDMRNGKHSIAYKITDGGVDDFVNDRDPSWDASNYNLGATNNTDREEWTLTYGYQLNNNWTVSVGLYEGTLDWAYTRDNSNLYNEDTINEYTWTSSNNGMRSTTSEGGFIALGYQNKISDKVFWFSKLGFQSNDLEIRDDYNFSQQFNAVDPSFQTYAVDYFAENYGMTNAGFSYSASDVVETDGDSTVFGLGLVFVINPKNTIVLEYESKTYSYDSNDGEQYLNCTGFAYYCDEGTEVFAAKVDEEAAYITLRYRYAF